LVGSSPQKTSALERLLTKLFGPPANVKGSKYGSTHYFRWAAKPGRIYIHHFVGDDNRPFHTHSKRFLSIGLWGEYWDETSAGFQHHHTPWLRIFERTHCHRVHLYGKHCWTVIIVLDPS
jgi:hypothetical protein